MDKTILKRLGRMEAKMLQPDGVGILELQLDGSWILKVDGRTLGQYTTEAAGVSAFRGEHLIIIDV